MQWWAYCWIQFNKLQAFSKNLRDTANFFGTLEPLIDDFEKLSNSLNASATITTSELPAQSSNAGDSRVTERSVQGIQQAFMNLRREVADQHGQLRRIEQRLTRANDAVSHLYWASYHCCDRFILVQSRPWSIQHKKIRRIARIRGKDP